MKAAVVTDFHAPLQVLDVPDPEPGLGEVLVRIETSGLCHTDIHAAHGDWPVQPVPPFIPGHEGIGRIEKLGAGVTLRQAGDRVAIAWLGSACGQCRYCISGWETLCEQQQNSGYSVNGTFAEYAVLPAAFATPVPDIISSLDAAPLTCAGVTTYKAVKVARVAPAETVAVFGVGGLGHLALQYAQIAGGFTIGVDIEDSRLAMATELGADHVVNDRSTDPVEFIHGLGGADVAVALAASPASFDQAYRSLRRGGRLVCVALPADNGALNLPIFDTVDDVVVDGHGEVQDAAELYAAAHSARAGACSTDDDHQGGQGRWRDREPAAPGEHPDRSDLNGAHGTVHTDGAGHGGVHRPVQAGDPTGDRGDGLQQAPGGGGGGVSLDGAQLGADVGHGPDVRVADDVHEPERPLRRGNLDERLDIDVACCTSRPRQSR